MPVQLSGTAVNHIISLASAGTNEPSVISGHQPVYDRSLREPCIPITTSCTKYTHPVTQPDKPVAQSLPHTHMLQPTQAERQQVYTSIQPIKGEGMYTCAESTLWVDYNERGNITRKGEVQVQVKDTAHKHQHNLHSRGNTGALTNGLQQFAARTFRSIHIGHQSGAYLIS